MRRAVVVAAALTVLLASARAEDPLTRLVFDEKGSELKLFVKKRGALSAFAHDHDVIARKFSGTVEWDPKKPERSSVEITVDVSQLDVLQGKMSESDRKKVQDAMLSSDILDAKKFPEVSYKSGAVTVGEKDKDGRLPLTINGKLKLHGVEKPAWLKVSVIEKDGGLEVAGEHTVKQSDHGIEPYSTAFGAVGVEDDVQLSFKIMAKKEPPPKAEKK
jgi:polyisoprenoid-binding protein YceI